MSRFSPEWFFQAFGSLAAYSWGAALAMSAGLTLLIVSSDK